MDQRWAGIAVIVLSTILCFLLSMSADMTGLELGALFNLVVPPMIGAIAIFLFLVVTWITKDRTARIVAVVALSLYLVYVGIAFHFGKDHWPLMGLLF